ncbi:MAG TPA: hypothetical protein VFV50_04365, partial [Bdellovibrionales bacterium]|nr:hypothetical protein [Bdellovibrionales bacterium]
MYKKVLASATAFSLMIPSSTLFAQGAQTDTNVPSEAEVVAAATAVAENMFFVQQLKGQLVEQEKRLDGIGQHDVVDAWANGYAYTAYVLAATTGFLIYRGRKMQDIRTLFYYGGAFVTGGTAAGMGLEALLYKKSGEKLDDIQRGKIAKDIQTLKGELDKYERDLNASMSRLRPHVADLDAKILAVVSNPDNLYRVRRVTELRSEIGSLRADLSTENREFWFAALSLAGSVYTLGKTAIPALETS